MTTTVTRADTAMTERLTDLLANLFSFDVTADLLQRDFVQQALLAAALLALVSGLIGPFIVMRQMSFAYTDRPNCPLPVRLSRCWSDSTSVSARSWGVAWQPCCSASSDSGPANATQR